MVLAAPPPTLPPKSVFAQVHLTADPVPFGGLLTSLLGNQVTYCSIICPDIGKLVVTVPIGALTAPLAFVEGLASGNPLKAVGAAAASITNPLEAAFDPIITNDLTLVLPRAQNALQVAVVGLLNIAAAGPAGFVNAVEVARQRTFDALNDTIPPTQTSPDPHGLVQVFAVEAINVASSIAFQAFEEGLLGVVQTVDATATALAQTGNPAAAFAAGESAAFSSLSKTLGYITTAAHNAAVNIGAAAGNPLAAQAVAPESLPMPRNATRAITTSTKRADSAASGMTLRHTGDRHTVEHAAGKSATTKLSHDHGRHATSASFGRHHRRG